MDFLFGRKEEAAAAPARRTGAGAAGGAAAAGKRRGHLRSISEVEGAREEPPAESDDVVVGRLPEEFYRPQTEFDPILFALEAAENTSDEEAITALIAERERQLDIINGRLTARVMQDYDAFVKGMMQIQQLGKDLQTTAILCRNGRANLKKASGELTRAPLTVVGKSRRMQRYRVLLAYVEKLQDVREKEQRLRQSLEEGDFPTAIALCLQCTKSLPFVTQFPCMRGLNTTLKESYELISQKLDSSLAEVTRNFDSKKYERVLQGYRLTGNSNKVLEKLQRLFIETIQSNTQDAVYAHVVISADNAEELKKMKFKGLCNLLEEDHFHSCLLVILEYTSSLMLSHYQMSKWHQEHDSKSGDLSSFSDIRTGLQRFRKNMWDEMQRKIVVMLSSSNLPSFKIDAFLQVLANVNTFIAFGEEFSGTSAHHLRGCIKQQSKHYFRLYHIKKTEDLYTMLENEMWAKIPVSNTFSLHDLIEYRSFLSAKEDELAALTAPLLSGTAKRGVSLLASYASSGRNPFTEAGEARDEDGAAASMNASRGPAEDADEMDEELLCEYVEEGDDADEGRPSAKARSTAADAAAEGPVLTSATINLIKFIGKYIEMMSILQPIAFDVFIEITHLFEYYVYAMILFFGHFDEPEVVEEEESMRSKFAQSLLRGFKQAETTEKEDVNKDDPKYWLKLIPDVPLRTLLLRIEDTLIVKADETENKGFALPSPHLSEMVDLSTKEGMYGIPERAVAMESLVFLVDTLEQVKPHIQRMIPKQHVEHLERFFTESVVPARGMRRYVYESSAARLVDLSKIPKEIEKTKWDIKEIGVDTSPYVDTMIREMKTFMKRMAIVEQKSVIPAEELTAMKRHVIQLAMDKILEGYGLVTKCSPEGRTLMSLDSQSFKSALERLTDMRPLPKAQLVDNYIKAFYAQEDQLLRWILDYQDDYTVQQLMGLVSVTAPMMPKKAREQLWSTVEAVCANKKRGEQPR